MTTQNHNTTVSEQRPAVTVQDPLAATARDRREYTYRGYSVVVGPSLVGYTWSAINADRMARAISPHKTVKEASQEAERVVDHCIRMYHQ